MDVRELLRTIPLTRGFVFKSVFGERLDLCKRLLEVTLGISVSDVAFVRPEREIEPLGGQGGRAAGPARGGRGREPLRRGDAVREARRRAAAARRYQALMDAKQLRKGEGAEALRNSIVVFICDFDPFDKPLGRNLRCYDCRLTCLQTGQTVPDGRQIIFLNIRGKEGEVTPELDRLLRTFAGVASLFALPVEDLHPMLPRRQRC